MVRNSTLAAVEGPGQEGVEQSTSRAKKVDKKFLKRSRRKKIKNIEILLKWNFAHHIWIFYEGWLPFDFYQTTKGLRFNF